MSDTEKQQGVMTHTLEPEKASSERKSVSSETGTGSQVNLANYYEEKAGSLVIDPECVLVREKNPSSQLKQFADNAV